MKSEELMIGDWVLAEGKPVQVTNISVLGGDIIRVIKPFMSYDIAYASNIVALSKGAKDINMIEPIPLTPEILESNNFQSKEDPYSHRKFFFLGKNEYNLDVYFDNGTIILVDVNDEPTVYAYVCDCKYVHNLQHILKDLKIEKEIAL